ncbi:hypothetical protein B0H14DRAFT_2647260 [Mycena olivaceomarginata]|nr:hypothetical protein B0H14DRAFT_2647260 [Mycena olivaceomarginata]
MIPFPSERGVSAEVQQKFAALPMVEALLQALFHGAGGPTPSQPYSRLVVVADHTCSVANDHTVPGHQLAGSPLGGRFSVFSGSGLSLQNGAFGSPATSDEALHRVNSLSQQVVALENTVQCIIFFICIKSGLAGEDGRPDAGDVDDDEDEEDDGDEEQDGDGAMAGAKRKNAPGKSSGSSNKRPRIDNPIDDPTLLSMLSGSPPPSPPPPVDNLLLLLVFPPPAPPVDNSPLPEPET